MAMQPTTHISRNGDSMTFFTLKVQTIHDEDRDEFDEYELVKALAEDVSESSAVYQVTIEDGPEIPIQDGQVKQT